MAKTFFKTLGWIAIAAIAFSICGLFFDSKPQPYLISYRFLNSDGTYGYGYVTAKISRFRSSDVSDIAKEIATTVSPTTTNVVIISVFKLDN